jgi:hypothetical protein
MLMDRLFTSSGVIKDNGAALENNASSCGCHHQPLEHTHATSDSWVDKAGAAFTHAKKIGDLRAEGS